MTRSIEAIGVSAAQSLSHLTCSREHVSRQVAQFALVACTAALLQASSSAQACYVCDDFEDGLIDPNKWEILLPYGNSAVEELGGELKLTNRGWLVSDSALPDPGDKYRLTGSVRTCCPSGWNADNFYIVLYADPTPAGCCNFPASGLLCNLTWDTGGAMYISGSGGVQAIAESASIPIGSQFHFDISVDQGTCTFAIYDGVTQSLLGEVSTTFSVPAGTQNRMVMTNRERLGIDHVTWVENFDWFLPDCNGNGVADLEDVASGTSQDCNTNGIPDECEIASGEELDCNANGIPDSCDIAAGLELDCNLNGIPDSCDLLAGTSLDCDGNGIPDSCDIAAGATDCDADGIPDACQIAADSTLDLNANGTLDACEALGTQYCSPAVTNSTGLPGEVTLLGSELAFFNQFQVSARQLPANAFGYFVCSLAQGPPTTPPFGSQGAICVSGNIGRGVGGGVLNSGPDGFFFGNVNLNAVPQPSGPVAVAPGETWHFQAWYRDANPAVTSNFTDAVAVTFQ